LLLKGFERVRVKKVSSGHFFRPLTEPAGESESDFGKYLKGFEVSVVNDLPGASQSRP